jgi:protein involved in polysaccharide export with SLBB domain
VNFVWSTFSWVRKVPRRWWCALGVPLTLAASFVSGCADQVRMPTQDQLAAFERAASVESTVDMDRIRKAKLQTGPYRVVPGDVLEFTMPALLRAVTAAEVQAAQAQNRQDAPFICRVSNAGTITLPAAGELKDVSGLSLAEVEERVVEAYQRHVVLRPSVFVRVLEYKTSKVYIAGAVEKAGVYTLRSDQMTLVSLLTEAGGIAVPEGTQVTAAGAAVVRIIRSDEPAGNQPEGSSSLDGVGEAAPPTVLSASVSESKEAGADGQTASEPVIMLPVVGMSIPFQDVSLEEGDTVVVEQVQVPLFTVIGLVNKPGNYEYPPTARYNLMQAIAFAGGLDLVSEPRYATIYRLTPEGSIARVAFRLVERNELTAAINTPIRPGDVVAIENTPRTRMNTILHNMVRFNTGLYLQGDDLWDRN